ncbi:hypothetical protein [Haloarchaeobius amylolyticus]|uniref:hypothetical protein n=1 Tax=Haloarchaeobius amylolyticus TaxID=1198296 RepID=UPI0022712753|nr:hypothetical protein [Haloarchaeobius amylolyticus]
MLTILSELVPELLAILAYAAVAVALSALGASTELAGWHNLVTEGFSILTVWYALIGGLLLYSAVVLVGYQRLLPRVRVLLAE